jgi:sortase (surface protein transpeptidase)
MANRAMEYTPEPSVTLITCYPFDFVGRAPQRFIVRARQVAVASPAASDHQESLAKD